MRTVVKYAKGCSDLLSFKSTGSVIQKLICLILERVSQEMFFVLDTRKCFLVILIFLINNFNIQ